MHCHGNHQRNRLSTELSENSFKMETKVLQTFLVNQVKGIICISALIYLKILLLRPSFAGEKLTVTHSMHGITRNNRLILHCRHFQHT